MVGGLRFRLGQVSSKNLAALFARTAHWEEAFPIDVATIETDGGFWVRRDRARGGLDVVNDVALGAHGTCRCQQTNLHAPHYRPLSARRLASSEQLLQMGKLNSHIATRHQKQSRATRQEQLVPHATTSIKCHGFWLIWGVATRRTVFIQIVIQLYMLLHHSSSASTIWMTIPLAAPPPLHIAAQPYSPFLSWCRSVTRMREPELPRACPREMAPPRGLTLAFSKPRICRLVSRSLAFNKGLD